MTRVYGAADREALMKLAAGEPIAIDVVESESEDEEHEFEAMMSAAERGPVVVTAEVESVTAPVRLENVEAFHVDMDDSGDLAWFARQELIQVIEFLTD
jgi:hypothetical protein